MDIDNDILYLICLHLDNRSFINLLMTNKCYYNDYKKFISLNNNYYYDNIKEKLDDYIFKNILHITDDLDIPHQITQLIFDDKFNKQIKKHVLPKLLTHLKFGWDFNQPINENLLPQNIKEIKLSANYKFKKNFSADISNKVIYVTYK